MVRGKSIERLGGYRLESGGVGVGYYVYRTLGSGVFLLVDVFVGVGVSRVGVRG